MKQKIFIFLQRYWTVFAIILIIALGVQVRLLDYRWPYLRNIDSYAFARQIEEVSKYGGLLPKDDLILSPYGLERTAGGHNLYVYISGYAFNFFKFFMPDLTLFQFLLWFPALLASLMAIPMYFIGKTLFDRKAGVLAALFIIFDVSIMTRTLGGDPDNDGSVLLMPLVAIAAFLIAYKYANTKKGFDKKYIFYTIISGITLALWGFTWTGYWFVVWLLTGFVVIKILIEAAKSRNLSNVWKESKHTIIVFLATILIFFIIMVPFFGLQFIGNTISGPFQFGDIKSEENREFPNVYVSVAELQTSGDIKTIIQRTAAVDFSQNPVSILVSPFFLMVYGLIYLIYGYIKRRQHLDTLILLLIWFLGPFVATIIAVRFSILFSAPIAIGSAIFLAKILRMVINREKLED